jgi:WD40 repeat protein
MVQLNEANNGWTRIWRTQDGTRVARSTDNMGTVRKLSWNSAGDCLAAGDDGSLVLWRTDGEANMIPAQKVRAMVLSLAFSPQRMLAATDKNAVVIYQ